MAVESVGRTATRGGRGGQPQSYIYKMSMGATDGQAVDCRWTVGRTAVWSAVRWGGCGVQQRTVGGVSAGRPCGRRSAGAGAGCNRGLSVECRPDPASRAVPVARRL